MIGGERAKEECTLEEEDLFVHSIKKAEGMEYLKEVMNEVMTESPSKKEENSHQPKGITEKVENNK